jgi:hypothetical protein
MTLGLAKIPASEFIRRVIERPGVGNWFALVTESADVSQLARQIAIIIGKELGETVTSVVSPPNVDAVVQSVTHPNVAIISQVDEWPAVEWMALDTQRSRLLESKKVIWVLSSTAASKLFSEAPHFSSFFTGSVWEVDLVADVISDHDRRARISSLESWASLSTAEMVARAEKHELDSDPRYAEWLALAGRSDLL